MEGSKESESPLSEAEIKEERRTLSLAHPYFTLPNYIPTMIWHRLPNHDGYTLTSYARREVGLTRVLVDVPCPGHLKSPFFPFRNFWMFHHPT